MKTTGDDGKISFIVRARNEQEHIGFSLQSIIDHFGPKTPILVVNNESTDETLDVVHLFPKKFHNIQIIDLKQKEYTPGKALNLGVELAQTKIVGILSAHCQISQLDANVLFEHFADDKCFGVIGKQMPVHRGKKINPKYIWANFQQEKVIKNLLENVDFKRYFFHNAFSFINKDIWEVCKFDEELSGKEDRYWAENLINLGYHSIIDPSLTCYHFWTKRGATWMNMG